MKILDAHRSGLHVLLAVFAMTSYGATTFAFGAGDPTRGATAFQACIAYLKAVAEGKTPTGAHGDGMMMNMTPAREDLKKAPRRVR